MTARGSAGVTLLGGVAVASFFVALLVGAWLFGKPASGDDSSTTVLFTGLVVFVVGALALQWRSDPVAATQVFVVLSFILAVIMGAVAWYSSPAPLSVVLLAALSALGFIGGTARYLWSQSGKNDVGNPLLALVGRGAILEYEGLQFALEPVSTDFGGVLRMVLQNCYDGPRKLYVTLEPASGFAERRAIGVLVPPLAVLKIELPVVVRAGEAVFKLRLQAEGTGRRRRTWVAQTYENEVTSAERVVGLAVGVVRWGGGASFRFAAGPASDGPVPPHSIIDVSRNPEVLAAIRQTGGQPAPAP